MTQSLAQLQAEWRAMKDEGVSDFDSGVVAGFGGAANELQPHVEREAAAQAKSLADERRIASLESALRDLLEQIDCLDGIEYTKDLEPYKAEAVWDDVLRQAQNALAGDKT